MHRLLPCSKLILSLLALVLCAACSSAPAGATSAGTVQAYLDALAAKDLNRMIGLSCAEWESQARTEYDSFAAVKLALEDVACKEASQAADSATVACTGAIVASYGAEDLRLELAERIFKVTKEGGEWRMCGY